LYLKDNPGLALEIENLIREKYQLPLLKAAIKKEPVAEEVIEAEV
jgi:recombination protein RecA